jgi:hypothetical protein
MQVATLCSRHRWIKAVSITGTKVSRLECVGYTGTTECSWKGTETGASLWDREQCKGNVRTSLLNFTNFAHRRDLYKKNKVGGDLFLRDDGWYWEMRPSPYLTSPGGKLLNHEWHFHHWKPFSYPSRSKSILWYPQKDSKKHSPWATTLLTPLPTWTPV